MLCFVKGSAGAQVRKRAVRQPPTLHLEPALTFHPASNGSDLGGAVRHVSRSLFGFLKGGAERAPGGNSIASMPAVADPGYLPSASVRPTQPEPDPGYGGP